MQDKNFIEKEIDEKKKNLKTIIILGSIGAFAFLLLFAKEVVGERYYDKRKVVCIPTKNEFPTPMVYHQTVFSESNHDVKIKLFIEEFVRAKYDESIVNYHALSTNREVSLSQNILKAIDMAKHDEKQRLMKKYARSDETFRLLKRGNVGWVFLIDDIIVYPMPEAGVLLAKVRGEYQVTYDSVKVDLPSELWGYKEITLLISQGHESEDEKGEIINKQGLYVVDSNIENLSLAQKTRYTKRNHKFYLEDINTSFEKE